MCSLALVVHHQLVAGSLQALHLDFLHSLFHVVFVLLFVEQNGLELPLDVLALVALPSLFLKFLALRVVVCALFVEVLTEWLFVHFDAPAHWLRRKGWVLGALSGSRSRPFDLLLRLRHARGRRLEALIALICESGRH